MIKLMKRKVLLMAVLCFSSVGIVVAIICIHKKHAEKLAWEQLYNECLDAGFRSAEISENGKATDIEEARRILENVKAMKGESLDTTVHWVNAIVVE